MALAQWHGPPRDPRGNRRRTRRHLVSPLIIASSPWTTKAIMCSGIRPDRPHSFITPSLPWPRRSAPEPIVDGHVIKARAVSSPAARKVRDSSGHLEHLTRTRPSVKCIWGLGRASLTPCPHRIGQWRGGCRIRTGDPLTPGTCATHHQRKQQQPRPKTLSPPPRFRTIRRCFRDTWSQRGPTVPNTQRRHRRFLLEGIGGKHDLLTR
jgi:hypothetical protein